MIMNVKGDLNQDCIGGGGVGKARICGSFAKSVPVLLAGIVPRLDIMKHSQQAQETYTAHERKLYFFSTQNI